MVISLAAIMADLRERYAGKPITVKPSKRRDTRWRDRMLEIHSPGKFSHVGWHPEVSTDKPISVYLSAGLWGCNGTTHFLDLNNPDSVPALYELLDGHHLS